MLQLATATGLGALVSQTGRAATAVLKAAASGDSVTKVHLGFMPLAALAVLTAVLRSMQALAQTQGGYASLGPRASRGGDST